MALLYPDILQHNNSTKALVDITEIRGNSYPINLLSDTGSIPVDKRKVGAIVFVSSSQNFYGFYGQTTGSWDTPTDWRSLGGTINTGSFVTTSSFNAFTSSYNTGSFTGSFTGSLFGTSSWAISASNAQTASYVLQAVSASYAQTASYAINPIISGSINNVDYIDFNPNKYDTVTPGVIPTHKEGRLFYDTGSQTLCMYNAETDITLNIGQESWLRARNQSGTTIANGSVVRLSGAVGNRPSVVLAQAVDQVQNIALNNDVIGMATHDIETGTDGFVTTFGLVNGVNTAAYAAGDLLWVSQSAGMYTNIPPSAPIDKTFVGIVTRANANNGSIFVTPSQPLHFHDLSSVSASIYTQGDIWMFRQSGSSGVWTNTKTLSGSYTISGSLNLIQNVTANSFSGSFSGSGANLNSIPTTAIVGNFTQIATGSVTASVTPTQFSVVSGSMTEFVVTGTGVTLGGAITDTHRVTGSLIITGSNTVIGNQTITGSLRVSSSNATQFLVGNQSLFVNSLGNVGIGTITPNDSLEISSSLTASLKITGTGGSLITIARQGTPSQTGFIRYPVNYQIGTVGSDALQFLTNNAVRMTVSDTTGNVGIGTAAPTATLDVAGFTRITPTNAQLTARSSSLTLTGTGTATSGNSYIIANTTTFAPTTGNATYASFYDGSTINPTNGLSTISRGLYINPTIQSIAEYRAIEFTNNSGFGIYQSGSAKNSLNGDFIVGTNNTGSTAAGKLQIIGSSATTGNVLVVSNSTPINLLTVQNNGQVISNTPTVVLAASQSAFIISQSISHSAVVGASVYGLNLVPTFFQTTSSQTEIALRVAPTFLTSSAAATSGSNIIADFGSLGTGTQFTVNDVTSGSIYLVNDVSGLPIIEATSNWDVNIYDYPTKVLQKTGSQIIINGTLKATGSFILPLSQSTSPQIGSAYWSGSFLFVHNGTRYMSASFF